jgi:hypothetical protein
MYEYIVNMQWSKLPSQDDVLAGISLMGKVSFLSKKWTINSHKYALQDFYK